MEFTRYLVHSQNVAKFFQYRMREFPRWFAGGTYPPNTLLIVDRQVREEFLIEVAAVAPRCSSDRMSAEHRPKLHSPLPVIIFKSRHAT